MSHFFIIVIALLCTGTYAQNSQELYNNCPPSSSQIELDINNVRTMLLNAGDMWWNLSNARYEVPKGSGKHSLFAGALWIGALDDNDNIKVAAQSYRQTGNDFWPGPIDADTSIHYQTCLEYDQHYSVLRSQVLTHKTAFEHNEFDNYQIPEAILNWPGNYYNDITKPLAPFEDLNQNSLYEPELGEYPAFDFDRTKDCRADKILMGDQSVWWVMNDVGNTHTESGSQTALGLEIQAQAFAISSNDALNNTTFYQYTLINKSNSPLHDTYFGNWVDVNIGNYQDDFIGCHVTQGLGYCYNGDAEDETASGYGEHPPAIGIDIVQGPLAPINDEIDNDYDGEIDEESEELRFTTFLYPDGPNDTPTGTPGSAADYYSFLRGIWLDGALMTFGENGRTPGNPSCNFMYPENTDPSFPEQTWSEYTAGNLSDDRMLLQSLGPFTFAPGEIHTITNALVWSQDTLATENPHLASLEKLLVDDQFVQEVFDSCFEVDCSAPQAELAYFELIDLTQGACETKAIQFYYPEQTATYKSNKISWDFGDGSSSSEFNPYHTYALEGTYEIVVWVENDCGNDTSSFTIEIPCRLADNIPSVEITRVRGKGNGNRFVDLKEESINNIMTGFNFNTISYKEGYGPFQVFIIEPFTVTEGSYQLSCVKHLTNNRTEWLLENTTTNDTIEFTRYYNHQEKDIINTPWGFDIQVDQMENPNSWTEKNGAIGIKKIGPIANWLDFIKDSDDFFTYADDFFIHPQNWIRSGKSSIDNPWLDPDEYFETEFNGEWAPYRMVGTNDYTNSFEHSPAWDEFQSLSPLKLLNNVDLVFTSDTSKWTRVPIIETGNTPQRLNLKSNSSVDKLGANDGTGTGFGWFPGYAIDVIEGKRLNLMFGESSTHEDHNGDDMLWNPTSTLDEGYVYADVTETPDDSYDVIFGGRHYIYITKSQYQGANETLHPFYENLINMSSSSNKRKVFKDIVWVSLPIAVANRNLLSEDITIQLRVNQAFQEYPEAESGEEPNLPIYQFNIDRNDYYTELAKDEFLLFPNPAGDHLQLILDNDSISSIYTQIYTNDGRLIFESKEQTNSPLQMDVSSLPTGIYHCVLYGDRKQISAQSFVKD